MGCIFAIIGLAAPRLFLAILYLFTSVPNEIFKGWFWPLLGFFFLPTTTLAYIGAKFWSESGSIEWWGVLLIILGILIDLGSAKSAKSS